MDVTNLMIKRFNIRELGYDFMGYSLQTGTVLTFHHLIIPNRLGGRRTIDNGAILCGDTAHTYLHLIELLNQHIFNLITSEMIDENLKGHLDVDNLKRIHNMLVTFEREHRYDRSKKGKILVKEDYLNNRLKF